MGSSNTSSPTNENESPQEVMVQDGLDMHAKNGPDLSAVSHLEELVLNRLKESDFKGDKKLTAVINGSKKHDEGNTRSHQCKPKIDETECPCFQEMQDENVEKLWTSLTLREKVLANEDNLSKMHKGRE